MRKLRGYLNHYGVIGNYDSLEEFYTQPRRILYKWLNRRSQRRSFNYEGFSEVLRHYRIEKPRITEKPTLQHQFSWSWPYAEASTVEELGAVVPHAEICAGAAG